MKNWLAMMFVVGIAATAGDRPSIEAAPLARKKVYVVPVRDDITPPMVYLVRRGVKEAMAAKADLLVLDMDTNGGLVSVTEDIVEIINQFKGATVTFVNRKAFSAGAWISFSTHKIYMAPRSVIGAAAPIIMSPGGGGVEQVSETLDAKMSSAISALVRANAEKNGHNVEVADAMVKTTKTLTIDGNVLNEKGQILTLTNMEAEKEYGDPGKRLLSAGTVESLDALIEKLGFAGAERVNITPTGAEKLANWINFISPVLLIIGIAGFYIEFKTPGFGAPGIVGIVAFALYFLGGYVAGLSGAEWVVVFLVGIGLVVLELFVFPGTALLGLAGAACMFVALVMAMADVYPGMPPVPSIQTLQVPLRDMFVAFVGAALAILALGRWLPKTSIYGTLVSQSASGVQSGVELEQHHARRVGQIGVAVSPLRPGGKAQFGDDFLDVISQGNLIERGQKVRIIGHSGTEAVVESVT